MSFKEKFFAEIKKGNKEKAVDLFFQHISNQSFVQQCGLLLHPCMPHKIGLPHIIFLKKEYGVRFCIYQTLDWLKGELETYVYPEIFSAKQLINLEAEGEKLMKRKAQKWNEDTLQLSKQKYDVRLCNAISLAEKQRLIALLPLKNLENLNSIKPLFPEEWVTVRL